MLYVFAALLAFNMFNTSAIFFFFFVRAMVVRNMYLFISDV